ncbi:hypothetical protein LguiA_012934 [Lonicera macranthoides]
MTNINHPSITISYLQSITTFKRTSRNVSQKKTALYCAEVVSPDPSNYHCNSFEKLVLYKFVLYAPYLIHQIENSKLNLI